MFLVAILMQKFRWKYSSLFRFRRQFIQCGDRFRRRDMYQKVCFNQGTEACSGIMGECHVTRETHGTNEQNQHSCNPLFAFPLFTYKVSFEFKHPHLFIAKPPAIRLQVVESLNHIEYGNNNRRTTRTCQCCQMVVGWYKRPSHAFHAASFFSSK